MRRFGEQLAKPRNIASSFALVTCIDLVNSVWRAGCRRPERRPKLLTKPLRY
jgi:hypothetical protein